MQRQKSILSFMKKPSPPKENAGADSPNGQRVPSKLYNLNHNTFPANNPAVSFPTDYVGADEVRGTDTPPEKLPRPIFAVDDDDSGVTKPSLFSSIRHKFIKVDNREKVSERNQTNNVSSKICSIPIKSEQIKEHDDDIGPDTPGLRPLVPKLKRVQEDISSFGAKNEVNLLNSAKRAKYLEDLSANKKYSEDSEANSKFEWLLPSRIKDGNGKRPNDPCYDKRTLYIPNEALRKMSASQRQYWDVKSKYMDVLLFFKVGKFYELYEIDAEIGHKELDWKMTQSGVGKCRQVGISESGIDEAVQKLLARGYKVGRIEQLETSEQAKSRGSSSVIQRKLVNVLTPSTTSEGNIGPDAVRLLAIKEDSFGLENGSTRFGFAFVDCAALKFWVGSISDDASCAALGALLVQASPKEVLYNSKGMSKEAQKALKKYSLTGSAATELTAEQQVSDFIDASEVRNFIEIKGYFKKSCNMWAHVVDKITHSDLALCALGGLINHLSRLMLDDILRNGDILSYEVYRGCLRMDGQTFVNLEIFNNNADGGTSGTLFKYLDNCITPSGKRLLRNWICHPLKDVEKINHRLDIVEKLLEHSEITLLISQYLRRLPDLERLLGRVKSTIQSSSCLLLPLIGGKILKQRVKVFGTLIKGLRMGIDLLLLIEKEGYISNLFSKIFTLPMLSNNNGLSTFLKQFEAALDSDFPNYQDHISSGTDAETLTILMELFTEKSIQWSEIIHAINCIDVLRSFAITANSSLGASTRPVILPLASENKVGGPTLLMKGLWHPYALSECGTLLPVPNDIHLGGDTCGGSGASGGNYTPNTLLLTGPNMGGKSTLLRATCLAVVLAQLGCYVPCEVCVLSLVDIVFTRLGSTDRIMTGESTFFIECTETASVLQNATQNSIVILDELGRGTSTFDGYAIAYAVLRHLVEMVNCRLLFATHYHPLTKEFGSHPRVKLQHMACSFTSSGSHKELVFLYKLVNGACPESYGMQVALMAGIPKIVVDASMKAGEVMKQMISENFKSSERRVEFSSLHEEWLKSLVMISRISEGNFDDDVFDTLFCLWHEVKNSCK